eukprot:11438683-Prorocentrum_lima.AAC.1
MILLHQRLQKPDGSAQKLLPRSSGHLCEVAHSDHRAVQDILQPSVLREHLEHFRVKLQRSFEGS